MPPKAGARTPGHRLATPARVLASVAALGRAAQPPRPGPCPHPASLHALPGNRPVRPPADPWPARIPTAALPAPTPPRHLRSAAAARSLSAEGLSGPLPARAGACGPAPARQTPPWPRPRPSALPAPLPPSRRRKITWGWGRREEPPPPSLLQDCAPRTLHLTQTRCPLASTSQQPPLEGAGRRPKSDSLPPLKNPTPDLSQPPGAAEEPVASGLGPTAPDCGASRRRAKGGAGAEAGAFKRRGQPGPT